MIIGDDHGYPYFGLTGSEVVRTPNLDRLAEGGALFTRAHVTASVCRPSLRTLLTGLYPIQFSAVQARLRSEAIRRLPPGKRRKPREMRRIKDHYSRFVIEHFETLPRLLGREGYCSFEGGKYWEGTYEMGGFTEGMTDRVADHLDAGGEGLTLGRLSMEPVFDFMGRSAEQPFFVWFAPSLPHVPHDAPERFVAPYRDRGLSESAVRYYANCTWFDSLVGELVDYLEESGLRERTLLVYVSDNGWEQEPTDEHQGPLAELLGGRTGKLAMHENGFRTPIILNWPGRIPAGVRDEESLVSSVDLVPTILDYAGIARPEWLPGVSLQPLVEGGGPGPREALFGAMEDVRIAPDRPAELPDRIHNSESALYLRTERWHFIWYEDRDRVELYDKQVDPREENDLAPDHPALVAAFRDRVREWRESAVARFESGELPLVAEPAEAATDVGSR